MTVKSQAASHGILVLFNATPSQAAKFEGEAAEKARAAAEGLGHRCVTLSPAKDAKLMASLARGAFDKEGAPLLGAVTPRMVSELAAVADSAAQTAPVVQLIPKAAEAKAAANATTTAPAVETAAEAASGATDKPVSAVAIASQNMLDGGNLGVVSKEVAVGLWPEIASGHLVLAPDYEDGAFNGWWPAEVINRDATRATLKWHGFDDLPVITRPISQLALMHPDCKA
ncbi:hypothetical protein [Roseixanthobacter liquoris]|uniref:hypothetical protein n=4 Tax=Xanthobacteraceae TaxID=335928 RepID=UPI00372B2272